MIMKDEKFHRNEHLFWMRTRESYELSKEYENVCFKNKHIVSELKKLYKSLDLIILHGLDFKVHEFLTIPAPVRQKIVWVVWGHDLYRVENTDQGNAIGKIKYLIKKGICKYVQVPFVQQIKCIGIGFPYDENQVRKWYGNAIPVKSVPYDLGYDYEKIKQVKNQMKKIKDNQMTNILVGHSAYRFLNHIDILENLKKFQRNNLNIYIPLSYGDGEYKKQVVEYIQECDLNVTIIEDVLPMNDYLEFLSKMDIAVFDFKHQAALGNLYLLLYLEKKLYLSKDGILYNGFQEQGVSVFPVEEIKKIDFDELTNDNFDKEAGVKFSETKLDYQSISHDWEKMILECTKGEK